jgi:hypothetical protein
VRALLAGGSALLALVVLGLAHPPARSGANLTAKRTNAANAITADTPSNYLRLYSQGSDPAGLGNYAVKRLSSPMQLAATGADRTLAIQLGNYRAGGNVNRVFTVETPATLPGGLSQVTVGMTVTSALWSGNVATMATIGAGNGNGGGQATLTLGAGQKRQVNVAVPPLPGVGVLYQAVIQIKVTYAGYAGDFLSYAVPVTVYDGLTGAGP